VQTLLQPGHDSTQNRVTWNTQWNQPNAWPCFTYVLSEGIKNYEGIFNKQQKMLSEIRFQVNQNYLKTVASQFSKTGKFWEKYNAHDGSISVVNEYEMPAFFGWTAGIYSYYFIEYIGP
jgi:neutral trehalase